MTERKFLEGVHIPLTFLTDFGALSDLLTPSLEDGEAEEAAAARFELGSTSHCNALGALNDWVAAVRTLAPKPEHRSTVEDAQRTAAELKELVRTVSRPASSRTGLEFFR